jgi:hypothetical protein
MKRLIFLNRFFSPDHSATSQILSDLAFHLAGLGAEVHVITSQQLYDAPRVSLAKREKVQNVHVHRVLPRLLSDALPCGDAASTMPATIARCGAARDPLWGEATF